MKTKFILSVLTFFAIQLMVACTYENEEELFDLVDSNSVSEPIEVSLTNDIIPIINADCAISGCHVAGGQFPNLTVKANIISSASRTRSETQSGEMPRGRTLSLAEKNLIKNWVDQGAKDN